MQHHLLAVPVRCFLRLLLVTAALAADAQQKSTPQAGGEWAFWRAEFRKATRVANRASSASLGGLPFAVFYPDNEEDIANMLEWKTVFAQNWPVSVRSGKHSYEGLSAGSCSLVVDVSKMANVTMSPQKDTVTVEAGTLHRHLHDQLGPHSVGVVGASSPNVSVVGCTLGGCQGYLSGAFGTSSDNLLEARMVLANGTIVEVSNEHNVELFWALRGAGGGDFGVVTSMKLRAFHVPEIVLYSLSWPANNVHGLIAAIVLRWQAWMWTELPANASSVLKCSAALQCKVQGMYVGNDTETVHKSLKKLAALLPGHEDLKVEPVTYAEATKRVAERGSDVHASKISSMYFPAEIPESVVQSAIPILNAGAELPAAEWSGISLAKAGFSGLTAQPDTPAGLYHHSRVLAWLQSSWQVGSGSEVQQNHTAWVREFSAALLPVSQGAYRNYEDLGSGYLANYYSHGSLSRLQRVKQDVDPESVFWHRLSVSKPNNSQGTPKANPSCMAEPSWSLHPGYTSHKVLVGFFPNTVKGSWEQLAESSRRLTHVVCACVEVPQVNGELGITGQQEAFMRQFVATVSQSNPAAKILLSMRVAINNSSAWSDVSRLPAKHVRLGKSVRRALERFGFHGVDVDWEHPSLEDKQHFVELLSAIRGELSPKHALTIDMAIPPSFMEEAYDVLSIDLLVDYIFLKPYDIYPSSNPGHPLQFLTHFNAPLFSPNPSVVTAYVAVRNALVSWASRRKLVLGIPLYGRSYAIDGPRPSTEGALDWRTTGPSHNMTLTSGVPGYTAWVELQRMLDQPDGGWQQLEMPAMGQSAAWSSDTWVGFDSPQNARQKAKWIHEMGLGGGMIWPVQWDAPPHSEASLTRSFCESLRTCEQYLTLSAARPEGFSWKVPVVIVCFSLLLCMVCALMQLRKSRKIIALHDIVQANMEDASVWSLARPPTLNVSVDAEVLPPLVFEAPSARDISAMSPRSLPYKHQMYSVRYSSLMLKDAKKWLQNPADNSLAFCLSKQRGFVKVVFVVTMYAEEKELLERTLKGIASGVDQLLSSGVLRSWDEACIVIVADGIAKLPQDTADWFEEVGIYNPGLMNTAEEFAGCAEAPPEVALHCFEGIMRFEGLCPSQTMLLIKEQNAGKLDSQRWAFIGIAERLFPRMPVELRGRRRTRTQAEVIRRQRLSVALSRGEIRALDRFLVTVDAGTEPKPGSIANLIAPMRLDLRLAGTCGHMVPDMPGCSSRNPIVMSQVFEYEVGHILDKSMETMFGFIQVLPGAFSAYRFDAIRREQWIDAEYREVGPLVDYFSPLSTPQASPALLNMGLAEDRILCFKLVAMPGCSHMLRYCKDAKAVTDVPDTLEGILQQRRRWNNGAFFAKLHALKNYNEVLTGTKHSLFSRLIFFMQAALITAETIITWFGISFFYVMIILGCNAFTHKGAGAATAAVLEVVLISSILLQLVAYYDRKVPGIKWIHLMLALIYATCQVTAVGLFVAGQLLQDSAVLLLQVSTPFIVILVCSALHGKLSAILPVFPVYMLILPVYVLLGHIYGFCHTHDVSWGTKGIETVHHHPLQKSSPKEELSTRLASFRFRLVYGLITSNAILIVLIRQFQLHTYILIPAMGVIIALFMARFIGSTAFIVYHWLEILLSLMLLPQPTGMYGEDYERSQSEVKRVHSAEINLHLRVQSELRSNWSLMNDGKRIESKLDDDIEKNTTAFTFI